MRRQIANTVRKNGRIMRLHYPETVASGLQGAGFIIKKVNRFITVGLKSRVANSEWGDLIKAPLDAGELWNNVLQTFKTSKCGTE